MKKIFSFIAFLVFCQLNLFGQHTENTANDPIHSSVDKFVKSNEVLAFSTQRDEIVSQLRAINQLTDAKIVSPHQYYRLKYYYNDIFNSLSIVIKQMLVDVSSVGTFKGGKSLSQTDMQNMAHGYEEELLFADSVYNLRFKPLYDSLSSGEKKTFRFSLEMYSAGLTAGMTSAAPENLPQASTGKLTKELEKALNENIKLPNWDEVVVSVPDGANPYPPYKASGTGCVISRVIEATINLYRIADGNNYPIKIKRGSAKTTFPSYMPMASDTGIATDYGIRITASAYIAALKYDTKKGNWHVLRNTGLVDGSELNMNDLLEGAPKAVNKLDDKYLLLFSNTPISEEKLEKLASKNSKAIKILDDLANIFGDGKIKAPTNPKLDKGTTIGIKDFAACEVVLPIFIQFGK